MSLHVESRRVCAAPITRQTADWREPGQRAGHVICIGAECPAGRQLERVEDEQHSRDVFRSWLL